MMMLVRSASLRACAAALALVAVAGVTVLAASAVARPPLVEAARSLADAGVGGLSFEAALVAGCAAALLGATLWLAATTLLAGAAALLIALAPSSDLTRTCVRAGDRHCPRSVRRLVAAVVGVALAAGAGAAPALADTAPDPLPTGALTGLRLPDRTTGGGMAAVARRATVVTQDASPRTVVVLPGDSLWRIAARLLPADAHDAGITAAWHRLHAANAARTPSDPDLLLPGTRLTVPPLLSSHRSHHTPPREEDR